MQHHLETTKTSVDFPHWKENTSFFYYFYIIIVIIIIWLLIVYAAFYNIFCPRYRQWSWSFVTVLITIPVGVSCLGRRPNAPAPYTLQQERSFKKTNEKVLRRAHFKHIGLGPSWPSTHRSSRTFWSHAKVDESNFYTIIVETRLPCRSRSTENELICFSLCRDFAFRHCRHFST